MQHAQIGIDRFRGPLFDHFFVWAIPLIGILAALMVLNGLVSFRVMLALDLFLLGYHHVITTFTRFSFDRMSAAQNRLLLIQTPILVFLTVLTLVIVLGPWAITTIYLHWQWFHYTRQSEGISKAFGMKTRSAQVGNAQLNRFLFYLTPVTTFLAMSHRQPKVFLFMDVYTIPVPANVVHVLALLNMALFVVWFYRQASAVSSRQIYPLHLTYFVFHHLIYLAAYVLITDLTLGWLAINTWHNLQYILFVWVCNVNQHRNGFNPQRPVMSWLSQAHRAPIYLVTCVTIAFILYSSINFAVSAALPSSLYPIAVIVVYQSINFHHYIVDSVIWKLKKKPVRAVIGIQT